MIMPLGIQLIVSGCNRAVLSAGLHRHGADAKRHIQRFRASDVGGRDVVDVANRPTMAINTLVLLTRSKVSRRSVTAELLIRCSWMCQPAAGMHFCRVEDGREH